MINFLFKRMKKRFDNSFNTDFNNKVIINGKTYLGGETIVIENDTVIIDGVVQEKNLKGQVTIKVIGDLANLTTNSQVEIHGNVYGNVISDDSVTCGNVGGDITAEDSVICGSVEGNVKAGDSVVCANAGGKIL